ncbi:hypothetical protein Tco_0855616 [Tanacetum coccineum]
MGSSILSSSTEEDDLGSGKLSSKVFNAGHNVRNHNGYNAIQNVGNQNGNGNGNVVAAWAKGNGNGNNENQTQMLIAQKEEAGIQLQAEEFDLMAAVGDLDEIEEVNAN